MVKTATDFFRVCNEHSYICELFIINNELYILKDVCILDHTYFPESIQGLWCLHILFILPSIAHIKQMPLKYLHF